MTTPQGSPTPPLVASTTETAKPSNQELAAIRKRAEGLLRAREVIDAPQYDAHDQTLRDVVALVARVEALLAERDGWENAYHDAEFARQKATSREAALETERDAARRERDEVYAVNAANANDRARRFHDALEEIAAMCDEVAGPPMPLWASKIKRVIEPALAGEDSGRVAVLEAAQEERDELIADLYAVAPSQMRPEFARRRAVLAGGDAAPQTDNLGGDEVASSGGGS